MCHEDYPSLILQTRIGAIENIQEFFSEFGERSTQANEEMVQTTLSDALIAYDDFLLHGNLQSLEQAISKYEAVVKLIPESDPRLSLSLNMLGSSLYNRFQQIGRVEDINDAIERLEMAVGLTQDDDPDKPRRLIGLGIILQLRFDRLGNMVDIDDAISHQRTAIKLIPDEDPDKPTYSASLGTLLQIFFEKCGNVGYLDGAIVHRRVAVNLTPDDHPDKPTYLADLGVSLLSRFKRFGNVIDVDDAIIHQRAAVDLTPGHHPEKSRRLSNLSVFLQTRFGRLENLSDLDGAIIQQQAANDLVPNTHPDKPNCLTNLGACLRIRFEKVGNLNDLDSAIVQQRSAVDLTPDNHPNKRTYLTNLGNSLGSRFERLGNLYDLNDAIIQQQAAVDLTPDGHPKKSIYLNNLGSSLRTRFKYLGNIRDIDGAINQQQKADNFILDDHYSKTDFSVNLGQTFAIRFLCAHDPRDAEAAISHLSVSAQSLVGSPTLRFGAAQQWISVASLTQHHSLLTAYECALNLMPLVAWLGLPITDRHGHLARIGGIARDAAAVAIRHEQYDKALEWLEQGRSIVWNQILQLRTPVDELRSVNPDLADRLVRVSRLIDHGIEEKGDSKFVQEDAERYRALTGEWEMAIKEVRSLPNFEDFLKPSKISKLMDAAQNGPVVVLNIAEERCDALALVTGIEEVIHIPLSNITFERVIGLRNELQDLLYSNGIRLRSDRAAQKWADEAEGNDCKDILAELWTGLVKPVLDSLAFLVRVIGLIAPNLLMIPSPAPSRRTSTHLVVSDRTPCVPPNTCGWDI
jgi:tetratricopeptide (TPR) repeat protein